MSTSTTELPITNSSVEEGSSETNEILELSKADSIQKINIGNDNNNDNTNNSINSSIDVKTSTNKNNNTDKNHTDNNNNNGNNSTLTEENSTESIPNDPEETQANDSTNIEKNEDYIIVSKALEVLKHQLNRATKDIETLKELKKEALEDPLTFVLDLKSKKKLKRAPPLQKVISVPEIDWTKYKFIPECRYAKQTASLAALTYQYTHVYKKPEMYKNILETDIEKRTIRPPNQVSKEVKQLQKELSKAKESIGQVPSRAGSADMSDSDDDQQEKSMMNGLGQRRVSSQTGVTEKMISTTTNYSIPITPIREPIPTSSGTNSNQTQTHNQPWTEEEQRRLEELLEIYPDEPVQAQRFNKISKALGTRTPRQVGSRIQKYFIKLAKMGLPVPGRVNIPASSSSAASSRSGRGRGRGGRGRLKSNKPKMAAASGSGYNSLISGGITNTKISGSYYSTVPTVYMSDDESDDKVKETMLRVANPVPNDSDDNNKNTTDTVIHEGFACDSCGTEPIVGVLYKCTVCDESEEVDLCSKCMALGTFKNDQHTPDHTFEAIRTSIPPYYADNDYASPEHLGEYSYLGF
ncbi:unnamed protein product [Cunninghamella blakesleeana]